MLSNEKRERRAKACLTYVVTALKADDRGAPFRDFLDNWYAYDHGGFLNAAGNPTWFNNPNAAQVCKWWKNFHFHSRGAAERVLWARRNPGAYEDARAGGDHAGRFMVDHAIPVSVLRDRMFGDPALRSSDSVHGFLRDHYKLGLLTSEENAVLIGLHLHSRMPEGWNWNGGNAFARYAVALIQRYAPQPENPLPCEDGTSATGGGAA